MSFVYIYIHLAIKRSLNLSWITPIYVDVIVLVTNAFCCFIISTLNKRFLSYLILSYHVFTPNYFADNVKECKIMSDMSDSTTSDHFPVSSLTVELNIETDSNVNVNDYLYSVPSFPRVNWSDSHACERYTQYITELSQHIPVIDVNSECVNSR